MKEDNANKCDSQKKKRYGARICLDQYHKITRNRSKRQVEGLHYKTYMNPRKMDLYKHD